MTRVRVWFLGVALAIGGAAAVLSWAPPAEAQCPPRCETEKP
jgi:hypothetical protein